MSPPTKPSYAGYRFPPEVISHAIWLYFRFPLSLRMVEEMLAARRIIVSHETVRQRVLKFGQAFVNRIRRRLPRPGDKWHLDEVQIKIAGQRHWLWRAVDQDGLVLDVLVQSRRDKRAAKRLLRKLLKKQGRPPRVLITDKLASYPAAKRELMPGVEHRRHKGLNNRAENSHQPTRRRERQMKRFKSPGQVQRFLSAHDPINNLFLLYREHFTASQTVSGRSAAKCRSRKLGATGRSCRLSVVRGGRRRPRRACRPISRISRTIRRREWGGALCGAARPGSRGAQPHDPDRQADVSSGGLKRGIGRPL